LIKQSFIVINPPSSRAWRAREPPLCGCARNFERVYFTMQSNVSPAVT